MTALALAYRNDQELPVWLIDDWRDNTGALIDFSSGWTFELRMCHQNAPATTLMRKTLGITGSAAGVTVAWRTTDWLGGTDGSGGGLEAGVNPGTPYLLYVYARRTIDSFDAVYMAGNPPRLTLFAAPGTSAVSPSSYPITVTAASVTVADAGGYGTTTPKTAETMLQDAGANVAALTLRTRHPAANSASGAGKFVVVGGVGGASAAAVDGKLMLVPFRAVPGRSLDRIGVTIATLGAGSLVRLGIYADDGFGYPDLAALPLLDAGTVDSSTTGSKTLTISFLIPAPVIWLAAVSQGGTPPSWNSTAGGIGWQWADVTAASFSAANAGYQKTGVAGALPALGAITLISPSAAPMLYVRYV